MPDREKVIKGLECCAKMAGDACLECPYKNKCYEGVVLLAGASRLAADTLSLLKEQEPLKHGRWVRLDIPIGEPDFKCTACNISVHVPTCMGEPMYEFCPVCGAKMDLEEEEDAEKDL